MGLRRDKVAVSRLAAGLPLIVGAGFIPPAGVCATAGCGGMRAPRPTVDRVVATVRFGRSFRKVCRGGIHPARNPRAAANTRGRAMALPYQPQAGAGPRIRAAPKIRPDQAPLSKGARAEIGGLPPGNMPPPGACTAGGALGKLPPPGGALPKRAPPSVNGISRRSNPSVLASLGHLPLTREAKTVPAAARFAGRCKHRPLQGFVITHGRSHPGRPQHHRGCAAPPAFCRIILPFRRAACYNRQKPPHKTHQGGRRWN